MAPPFKMTPEQASEAAARYAKGDPMPEIAASYSVCIETIYNALERLQIPCTHHYHQLTLEQITEVKRRYKAGENSYQLAAVFGVSRPAISMHLRKPADAPKGGEGRRLYACNHAYFFEIDTPDKAYILGFIATDGCIRAGNVLHINLKSGDAEHLQKIANALSSTHPVKIFDRTEKEYSRLKTAQLYIASDQITADLARHGITPRKTFTVGWPALRPDLYRHYVRGAIDGDGSIGIYHSRSETNRHLTISFIGNEHLSPAILLHLQRELSLPQITLHPKAKISKPNELATLTWRYCGNRRCFPIINYLYEDATLFLDRKRQIVLDHYRARPKYRDLLRFG